MPCLKRAQDGTRMSKVLPDEKVHWKLPVGLAVRDIEDNKTQQCHLKTPMGPMGKRKILAHWGNAEDMSMQ